MEPDDVPSMVAAATAGDRAAWDAIVHRYAGLVWSVARAFRLGDADAADVSQATWLRLVEHLDQIRDPAALGAWRATTAAWSTDSPPSRTASNVTGSSSRRRAKANSC